MTWKYNPFTDTLDMVTEIPNLMFLFTVFSSGRLHNTEGAYDSKIDCGFINHLPKEKQKLNMGLIRDWSD